MTKYICNRSLVELRDNGDLLPTSEFLICDWCLDRIYRINRILGIVSHAETRRTRRNFVAAHGLALHSTQCDGGFARGEAEVVFQVSSAHSVPHKGAFPCIPWLDQTNGIDLEPSLFCNVFGN